MTESGVIKLGLLLILALTIANMFLRMDRDEDNPWKFFDMLMGTGRDGKRRADKEAFAFVGAFFVSSVWGTWLVWYDQLTEWFYGPYMLSWGAAAVANAIIKAKRGTPPTPTGGKDGTAG